MTEPRDLERFVAEHHPRLVGMLLLRTGNLELAEDVAQEALLKLVERWDSVKAMDSPWGWLATVAINQHISIFRRVQTRVRKQPLLERDAITSAQPEYAVEALDLLSSLPERQRTAVILRHYAGLSVAETAAAMGCEPGTVKSSTARARSALRESLKEEVLV
jgi:RNA polymerase sigma-70 factor (sigma-E family)